MAVTGIIKPTVAGTAASPNLGNGGADYNTAESELKKKIAQNQINIATNKGHVQSETARALQVIKERGAAGQDTSAQQKYLNTNLGYKAPTANTTNANANTNANPSTSFSGNGIGSASQIKSNTAQSSELMEQMKAIATKQATQFSYDPNSDPAYQAALKRAQSNIDAGNSQAQAEMNRRGILNSTITSDRMGEIASAEMGNVETTVIPQLMQQAYQKYIDAQNQEQQQFSNMGTVADKYNSEDQRAITNNFSEANITGNYVPEAAKPIISEILQFKQQAETPGITAAEKAQLRAKADGRRAQLLSMGVDPSAYAASVNYNNASLNPGIRTIAGQTLDASKQAQTFNQNMDVRKQNFTEGQQNWQNNFATEQQAYKVVRDAISDNQWKVQFDQSVNQFGLNYALSQLQESNQTAYQEAQLALSQDDSSRQWASLDYEMSNPAGTDAKYSGLSAAQVLANAQEMFPIATTGVDRGKRPTDAKTQDAIYQYVGNLGLPVGQDDQVMLSMGLTKETIQALDKQYGVSSGN